MYGSLNGVNCFLLEDIAGEEEKGSEDEDCADRLAEWRSGLRQTFAQNGKHGFIPTPDEIATEI